MTASRSLSRGISLELDGSTSSVLTADEPGTSFRAARAGSTRRGSTLHGQISTSSESSLSSSSERRRSSCLSDVSVRSSSSKRSSTGDFSSELDEYFDNVGHRSLQTAVIEEEVTQEHDGNVCGRQAISAVDVSRMTLGQHLLEHFVDNLINEAAQQSKIEIEQYLAAQCSNGNSLSSECLTRLQHYAMQLADNIITTALDDTCIVVKAKTWSSCSHFIQAAGSQRQIAEQHGRRFQRQQTVSGFRDAVLCELDRKLMSSNVDADGPVVTFGSKKRRSSEPASLNYHIQQHISSSADYRQVIASWFTGRPTADTLSDYVQQLVVDLFVEFLSVRRHRSSKLALVPDAILLYADRLTSYVLQAVRHELSSSASQQSAAERFARSIVDDAVALHHSSSSQRLLVSHAEIYGVTDCGTIISQSSSSLTLKNTFWDQVTENYLQLGTKLENLMKLRSVCVKFSLVTCTCTVTYTAVAYMLHA